MIQSYGSKIAAYNETKVNQNYLKPDSRERERESYREISFLINGGIQKLVRVKSISSDKSAEGGDHSLWTPNLFNGGIWFISEAN